MFDQSRRFGCGCFPALAVLAIFALGFVLGSSGSQRTADYYRALYRSEAASAAAAPAVPILRRVGQ